MLVTSWSSGVLLTYVCIRIIVSLFMEVNCETDLYCSRRGGGSVRACGENLWEKFWDYSRAKAELTTERNAGKLRNHPQMASAEFWYF